MAMHVVLTFDDNFWAPAYATMRSVCLYTPHREDLVFHLFHRTLSADHRSDLKKIQTEFPVALRWYDLDQSELFRDIAARMPENKRLSNIVYARLVIDQLVASDVERILYLDCDMLVRDDIAWLFALDMGEMSIGAVRDPSGALITGQRDLMKNRDLFDPSDAYFNAGMLLIDIAQWRDAKILRRMEEAYASGIMQRIYYDQDLLNLIFKNKWYQLPWRWNLIDARPAHDGIDPAIVHYTGDTKPWSVFAHTFQSVAFARLYRHVMTNRLFYSFARHRWKRWWLKKLRLGR
jgi:lipopolysaccharide biosynthesis glycosyltransferase